MNTPYCIYKKMLVLRLLALLLFMTGAATAVTAQNTLYVEDISTAAGKEASIPIYLDNSQEVVGVQFDITLPYKKSGSNPTLDQNRSNGHTVSLSKINDTKYTVVIMSYASEPFKGNAGLLLRFPVTVPETAQIGDTEAIKIDNIVVSNATGHNIAASTTSEATHTVAYVDTPDLIVSDLRITNTGETIDPNGVLDISFNVVNQGTRQTGDGWTEKVYLEDENGTRTYVGSTKYGATLDKNATLQRAYEVTIPRAMMIDGTVRAVVEILDLKNTGEQIADQGNNSAVSTNTKTLTKRLFFSQSRISLGEGKYKTITLTRSGNCTMAETFTLAEQNDFGQTRITVPQTVTIKAKQSAVSFNVKVIDDTEVNQENRTNLLATGNDYTETTMIVDVVDNDNYSLKLSLDKEEYTEGDNVTLTVTIKEPLSSDLNVTITNTDAAHFYPYVRSITIPAGQITASATTKVVEDNFPQADKEVTFKASATGYDTPSVVVNIVDDDWPTLSMVLVPNVVYEDDGYGASTAIITRDGKTEENLNLYLTSSNSEVYFDSQKAIIPAGEKSVSIPVSVKDNALIDGERTHTVTATGLDAFTGKTTGSKAKCSAKLTISDNDATALLKLQSSVATLKEGGNWTTVTVSRNSKQGDLVVSLSCDDPQMVFEHQTVTIKNNSQTASFKVKATSNAVDNDDHYVNVKASAQNFQSASFVFLISDQTRPDAIAAMPELTTNVPNYIYYTSQKVSGSIDVTNQGAAELPAGVEVELFLSDDRDLNINSYYSESDMDRITTLTTSKAIGAGETLNVPFEINMPDNHVGVYYLFGWVNRKNKVAVDESNTKNNYSKTRWLEIRSPYTFQSLSTDKLSYTPGEDMFISGQMSNSESGIQLEGGLVEVIIVGANNVLRDKLSLTLDAQGKFSTTYRIKDYFAGSYGIGVRCKGVSTIGTQHHISVTALKLVGSYEKLTFTEGKTFEGKMEVSNLSGSESLTNVTFSFEDLPEGWNIEIGTITTLQPGQTGGVPYKVTPSTATSGNSYKRIKVHATAKDPSGNMAEAYKTVDYYSKAATCKLATSDDKGIKTTLSKISQRTWTLTVENTGIRESGTVTVECPTDQPWLTAATRTLPSIPAGGQTELTLNLAGDESMIVDGTYKSYVKLKPQNGSAIIVNVAATLVSTDQGRLTVDVVDAFTLADETTDGPHVSGASVKLTNALTNEVAGSGTTDANGHFNAEIKEGTYYVYVTADNHYYSEKTITVYAGEQNDVQVFLPYKSVKVTYTVEETTVVDEYRTVITMDVVPSVPTAVLTPKLPDNWGCGHQSYSIRLTNQGRLTAYNPYLEFPIIDGYTFTVKSDYPQEIHPGDSYDVTVEFNGPEEQAPSRIGSIVMHYGYKLRGEMYYSSENYVAQVGCQKKPVVLPGGALGTGPNVNYGGGSVVLPSIPTISTGGERSRSGYTETPVIDIHNPVNPSDVVNRVALQFKQFFFLERQAFEGHLKVENLQMNGIERITLLPTVRRADDESDATDLFAISFKGIGAWAQSNDNWSLSPSGVGEVTVLYVPSKETAPTEKTDYLFGGMLSYFDTQLGRTVTVELMETQLTVNPSPDLHLTYFIQRDFISDDPRTEEVEPWEPAEFALLIQNKGAGEALDLKICTSTPIVIDNLDGKPIAFTKLYSTVDGIEKHYNFDYLELGSIPAGGHVMARWWFYTNQSAHVSNYDVKMTKHSSYGVEFDLIHLDGVRELTRTVHGRLIRPNAQARGNAQVPDTEANIYLLNMEADVDNLPDHVEDQNGEIAELEIVSDRINIASAGNNQYTLKVSASREGWVYGQAQDPTGSTMTLVKAIRNSDNTDVTSNFWQTNRTITSDNSTLAAYRLHFADNIGKAESYTLYFEPKPAEEPVVKSIELSPNSHAAKKAVVTFKNAIKASSFGSDDVVVMCGDKQYDVTVTPIDDSKFTVDWSGNHVENGYTTLTVFTSGIENAEGMFGTSSKSIEWEADSSAYIPGDVNGDGSVTITDVLMIMDYVDGKKPANFNLEAADMDGNGTVTIQDAIQVLDNILRAK